MIPHLLSEPPETRGNARQLVVLDRKTHTG